MKETKGTAYQASLMYYYNLSKRTQLYSGVSYSDGDKLLDTVDRFNQIFGTVGLQHRSYLFFAGESQGAFAVFGSFAVETLGGKAAHKKALTV